MEFFSIPLRSEDIEDRHQFPLPCAWDLRPGATIVVTLKSFWAPRGKLTVMRPDRKNSWLMRWNCSGSRYDGKFYKLTKRAQLLATDHYEAPWAADLELVKAAA